MIQSQFAERLRGGAPLSSDSCNLWILQLASLTIIVDEPASFVAGSAKLLQPHSDGASFKIMC